VLRRVRCTSLPTWQFLLGQMVNRIAVTLVGSLVLVATAVALFGVRLTPRTAPFAALVLVLAMVLFTGLGQLIASVVCKPETVTAVCQVVYFPLMFLSGLFIRLEAFPPQLQRVAQWLPGAVVVDLLRPALLQGSLGVHPLRNLALLLGYSAVVLVLSARFFRWDEA
jgi:ABC-2 type transport system permease protein